MMKKLLLVVGLVFFLNFSYAIANEGFFSEFFCAKPWSKPIECKRLYGTIYPNKKPEQCGNTAWIKTEERCEEIEDRINLPLIIEIEEAILNGEGQIKLFDIKKSRDISKLPLCEYETGIPSELKNTSAQVVGWAEPCFGKEKYEEGDSYIGGFDSDNYHGLGVYTFSDGSYYVGYWDNGKVLRDYNIRNYANLLEDISIEKTKVVSLSQTKNSDVVCDNFLINQNNEFKEYPWEMIFNLFYDFESKRVLNKYSYVNEGQKKDLEDSQEFIITDNSLIFLTPYKDKIERIVSTTYNFLEREIVVSYSDRKDYYLKSDCTHNNQFQVNLNKSINSNQIVEKNNKPSQVVTQVLNKDSIKEELAYYKELFDEDLIEKSEYDDLRKTLIAGLKEGSATKTIILNTPKNTNLQSQNDVNILKKKLELEKRKVEAMESQAQAAQSNNQIISQQNKIIKDQQKKKSSLKLMELGLKMLSGGGYNNNTSQTRCYNTALGFKCRTW